MIYYLTIKREWFPVGDHEQLFCTLFDSRFQEGEPRRLRETSIRAALQRELNSGRHGAAISICETKDDSIKDATAKQIVCWLRDQAI